MYLIENYLNMMLVEPLFLEFFKFELVNGF